MRAAAATAARLAARAVRATPVRSLRIEASARRVAGAALVGAAAFAVATPAACAPAKLPAHGVPGTKYERTFIAVKPDGVQRGLVGNIIARFEAKGYKLVALKMVWPTKEMASKHYADLSSKPFFNGLTDFFSSGPIVAMVWEGDNAILGGRKMLGTTNPRDSEPGSIRGDLCVITGRNIIHGSDGPDSAEHEINMWFKPSEVNDHALAEAAWVYED
ncbi:hypothetical protein FNF29_08276 [Cafeteria roenbergensis]|uniref:Nucleoside diphosphate kinase n=1 Tax=Cafeteria roenbergensis TaxID=33653 RepID=A0A5A8C052_CAFRO|nr:hypothetical protein FNF29_08276 [Cafeteria roenbergensis]|eukprot:KAA0146065.1 hypothetical protein FNF29_08276 [Cafeteria roenbergensis]